MRYIWGIFLIFTMTSWAAESDRIETLERQLAELMAKQTELEMRTDKLCDHWSDALEMEGYGEMYFSKGNEDEAMRSFYGFVPAMTYDFGETIVLNVELEFAYEGHGSHGEHDVLAFSYIDFLFDEAFNLSLGHLLVPVGNVNLGDAPPLFLGVALPETETYVIPTTRHHNGVLFHGRLASSWQYHVGVIDSLNERDLGATVDVSMEDDNVTHESHAAPVARLDFIDESHGLEVGISYLGGEFSYHDDTGVHGTGEITLLDAHLNYRAHGWDVKLLSSVVSVDDPGRDGDASGAYATVGYDLAPLFDLGGELMPYIGHERYDRYATQKDSWVTNTTLGVRYRPHDEVMIKVDYRDRRADEDERIVALGVGYLF